MDNHLSKLEENARSSLEQSERFLRDLKHQMSRLGLKPYTPQPFLFPTPPPQKRQPLATKPNQPLHPPQEEEEIIIEVFPEEEGTNLVLIEPLQMEAKEDSLEQDESLFALQPIPPPPPKNFSSPLPKQTHFHLPIVKTAEPTIASTKPLLITWKELLSLARHLLLMPWKLPNAPSTFTRPTNKVLRLFDRRFFVENLESVLVYGRKESKHLGHLTGPFEMLGTNKFYDQVKKCTLVRKDGHGANLFPFDPGISYKEAIPQPEFWARLHKGIRTSIEKANENHKKHGVSSTYNVKDLVPSVGGKELGTILSKEGGIDAYRRYDHHQGRPSQGRYEANNVKWFIVKQDHHLKRTNLARPKDLIHLQRSYDAFSKALIQCHKLLEAFTRQGRQRTSQGIQKLLAGLKWQKGTFGNFLSFPMKSHLGATFGRPSKAL